MPRKSSRDTGGESLTFGQGMRRVQIDGKGRITIPARYRSIFEDELHGDWIVYLVADKTRIDVLPRERYEAKYRRFMREDSSDPEDVSARRRFMVGTEIKGLDQEGRLTLSKEMQKMTGIGFQAVLIWMRGWLEIWSDTKFDAWLSAAPSMDDYERRICETQRSHSSAPGGAPASGQSETENESDQ